MKTVEFDGVTVRIESIESIGERRFEGTPCRYFVEVSVGGGLTTEDKTRASHRALRVEEIIAKALETSDTETSYNA